MKKLLVFTLACFLIFSVTMSCKKKVQEVPTTPQAKEQPKVEKVDDQGIKEPRLSEEEIFMSKTLEQINQEKPLAMIHFDYDQYNIRTDAKSVLDGNAGWLKKWQTVNILIEGHCDERGTEEYNLALGEKRAKSTMDYLLSLGVQGSRMKIISYGKSQPLDSSSNEIAWQKNRRAQFTIIAK
ncbi:MAG: peptidoglycan-associated lipoprotein Pal [Acidobacteriota bacterium]|nr:peptidoglycan-associated lipoprotein Pal [Acidobacteriota bacterium]